MATGDGGEVHKVTPDGKGSVFFRTEETHARSLAVDSKDNVIVGTEPGGLILRISPAGDGFVLHQAAKREVTALAVTTDGVIYAAAVGNKSGLLFRYSNQQSFHSAAGRTSTADESLRRGSGWPSRREHDSSLPLSIRLLPGLSRCRAGRSFIEFGPDNSPQRIWTHAQDIVYAIGFDSQNRPILGTGQQGKRLPHSILIWLALF